MVDPSLELKREFLVNQLPDLRRDLQIWLDAHPIYGGLPKNDRDSAASSAAWRILLAIRPESIVRLVR